MASVLRINGLAQGRRFANDHRVLNRAAWRPRAAARLLLGLPAAAFVPAGPVVLGVKPRGLPDMDDTIERRRGKRIAAPRAAPPPAPPETDRKSDGLYRDPVRSSRGHFVKASGLRWLSLMLLVPVPSPAAIRLRSSQWRSHRRGKRLPTSAAVLTDPATSWQRVAVPGWYGGGERAVEISSATAVCRHREAIRPEGRKREGACEGSDPPIARTTPCLLGLFSLVTLPAAQPMPRTRRATATSAWCRKQRPTFSDTLAAVRREIWRKQGFVTSRTPSDMRKLRPALRDGIAYAPCRAA